MHVDAGLGEIILKPMLTLMVSSFCELFGMILSSREERYFGQKHAYLGMSMLRRNNFKGGTLDFRVL